MTIAEESNLTRHARTELALLRDGEPDEMQDAIDKCVLDIVAVFAEQGHSGSSAAYVIGIVERVLRFEPVTPLTGDDGEWVEVAEEDGKPLFQNARCGRVFRVGVDGEAYDTEGRVFRERDGGAYTSVESRVPVTFPYRPATEFVDVE